MQTWIALLRGINVGGNNKLPMKDLAQLLQSQGFANVRTYIQSGNVVFQAGDEPPSGISDLIEARFGFRPEVFLLTEEALREAARQNPFDPEQGKMVHFFFCETAPIVDFAYLESLKADSEAYLLVDQFFYLYAPEGIGRSKLVEKMGKAFNKVSMTARNLNTINQLLNMCEAAK